MVQPAAMARGHLAGDLVHRPVPGGDQRDDADGFVDDAGGRRGGPRTRIASKRLEGRAMMWARPAGTCARGRRCGRAHLGRMAVGACRHRALVGGEDALQQLDALALLVCEKVGKAARAASTARSASAAVPMAMPAQGSSVAGSMTSSVRRLGRVDPGAVDVELQE